MLACTFKTSNPHKLAPHLWIDVKLGAFGLHAAPDNKLVAGWLLALTSRHRRAGIDARAGWLAGWLAGTDVRWPGKTAGIMIRSRVNLWCRDHDPSCFRVAGIILVVAQEIPAEICNLGPLTTPHV